VESGLYVGRGANICEGGVGGGGGGGGGGWGGGERNSRGDGQEKKKGQGTREGGPNHGGHSTPAGSHHQASA